jgi:hypothetical protein
MLLSLTVQAGGGVYKWVDEKGITHYDDSNLVAERLTRASIARRAVATDASATVPRDFVRDVRAQCDDLRERSAAYASASALHARDPFGNTYTLSAVQAQLTRAELARETTRYCRPMAAEKLLAEARADQLAAEKAKQATKP